MIDKIKSKLIFILSIIITAAGAALIRYRFFDRNLLEINYIVGTFLADPQINYPGRL
jgi:hypothetical protein